MWHHVFVETSSEMISLIKFIEGTTSQQDYLNSIRNQDSFTFEDYSEQLRNNPHLGKELSILYFEHQESEQTSSKEVWICLVNKKLVEPWDFKVCFKDLKSQANPPACTQAFIGHLCNHRKSLLASWPNLKDIWRSSFLLEKKAPLFLTDTLL